MLIYRKNEFEINRNITQIILLSTSLLILVLFIFSIGIVYGSENYSQNLNATTYYKLVNQTTNFTNILGSSTNDNFLPGIKNYSGTIADGVSRLLLVMKSNHTLKFSINDTKSDNPTNGNISPFNQPNKNNPLVVAVYTPPNYIAFSNKTDSKTINIKVNDNDTNNISYIPIKLYRVPIVLVHGIWTNSTLSWVYTNFSKTLENNKFNVSLANYGKYNATTFDPKYTKNGNYGIDSVRNTTKDILKKYNDKGIAASQVDIIAHSMGGLMARGFTQQSDYKNENNSMNGYIHRLITIGTPHFGVN